MSERTKKIIFLVFFISFTLGMAYFLYYMFTHRIGSAPTETPATTETTLGGLPKSGAGGKRQPTIPSTQGGGTLPEGQGVSEGEITTPETQISVETGTTLLRDAITQHVSIAPGSDQAARFYNPDDGRFYKINADGSTTPMGQKQFFNVQNVEWGKRTDQTIMQFPDGKNIYYDFTEKKQVPLPSHWQDFKFSDDDTHMVAKSVGADPENRFLIVSKPDGGEAKAIESLGENQDKVESAWAPTGQIVAYAKTGEPQSGGRQEIYLVGQNKENYRSLIVEGQGFLPNWSPTGKYVTFSVYADSSQNKPSLWVTSGEAGTIGQQRRKINLNTWADKCAWDSDAILYCAVPKDLPEFAGMDRDSYRTTPDEVYRVDLRSNISTKISTDKQVRPMQNIVISGDKTKLLFTDVANGKLYSYDLPK